MCQLDPVQLQSKLAFVSKYIKSDNAADGAGLDPNANVSVKNIATLSAELNKDINIQINRAMVSNKIEGLFGTDLAKEYIRQIENHEIYVHDETSLNPYCASITLYPFLIDGLTKLGGESKAPKNINSFCGVFVNLVFAAASQLAGALATVEFLMYFDHFARKEYGDNYTVTHPKEINSHLQHIVYSLNQPAASRGYQSVFWNISIYDEYYFKSMFGDFVFPTGEKSNWETVKTLQNYFMSWFNNERTKSLLTFPIVTAAMLIDERDNLPKDKEFLDMCAGELSAGNSFFIYQSTSADSLASCCRLRNEISDNTFSYTLGAGGVSTGSINVITINMNRLVQDGRDLLTEIEKIQKYQVAHRKLIEEYINNSMLPLYSAGFISLKKQYLTIGINGMAEAAEYRGISPSNNEHYKTFIQDKLQIIYDSNKKAKAEYGYLFNTEFVPAESLGVKNAAWDKRDGYSVNRDCYNSYFYIVEDDNTNVVDKFVLHGRDYIKYLDGGSALHLNLDDYLDKKSTKNLIELSAKTGCNYFCINVKITLCNDCGNIDKKTLNRCSVCKGANIDYATRIIGYLKRITSFSKQRQMEHAQRFYHRDKREPLYEPTHTEEAV